jgi:predicted nucleic acid-binding protein
MQKSLILDSCVLLDILDESRARHGSAAKLRDHILTESITLREPTHCMFEVCARLKNPDYRRGMKLSRQLTISAPLSIQLVSIDEKFFQDYYSDSLPYLKGGDLIFLALALKDREILITEDGELKKKSCAVGIRAYSIDEYLALIP